MKTVQSSSGSQMLAGYLAGIGCVVANVLSATCVQALQGAVPDFQLSAIRSAGQGLAFVTGGLIVGTDFRVGKEYIPGLISYGMLFLFSNVGWFGAAAYLPLAELQGVATIAGIVFAIIHSRLMFDIDIAKSNIIATIVCVVGIALSAQPAWLFNKGPSTSDTVASSHEVLLGYTLSILGGAANGIAFDINGKILRDVKTTPKAVYTMLVCTIGSVVFMFYLEDPVYVLNVKQLLLVLGHSLISAIVSFLAIYAGSIVPGPTLSIVWSVEVVTMLVSQYTLMHSIKPGNYNWIEVLGCIIIVFGASVPGVMDLFSHKAKANELP